jgi:hypothetical protein
VLSFSAPVRRVLAKSCLPRPPANPSAHRVGNFHPFYSNELQIYIDRLVQYLTYGGMNFKHSIAHPNSQAISSARPGIAPRKRHLRAQNRVYKPLILSALQKSAHLIESRQYQRACFHIHAHSFPASLLFTSFYKLGRGVYISRHAKRREMALDCGVRRAPFEFCANGVQMFGRAI